MPLNSKPIDWEIVHNGAIKYMAYFLLSVGTGFVSTLGETDFVASLSFSVLPILIALLVLYTTVSSLLYNQLSKFKDKGFEIAGVIKAMKRNVVVEVRIIAITFVLLSAQSWLLSVLPIFFPVHIMCNSVVVFALLYFVYVVYDSTLGLYRLFEYSERDTEDGFNEGDL